MSNQVTLITGSISHFPGCCADSDESGHLFQSMSDTIPILSDSVPGW